MATAIPVEIAVEAEDVLGEGPVWSQEEQSLYWVDILKPSVRRWTPETGEQRTWQLPAEVGSMALRERGGAVLALRTGFALLDFDTGAVTELHDPEPEATGNRFNDGKCDPAGRFWAGTMDCAEKEPLGALYRLDPDLRSHRMTEGVICSNGLGWSPDGRTMYYTDTWIHRIDAFDFDVETGRIDNRRTFVRTPSGEGHADGLTVDSEGGIWSARWDGWRVVRYAPDGSVDRTVELPVPRPTSCAFGGPRLSDLYVTSASTGLARATMDRAPLSGAVFRIEPGVTGLGDAKFAG